MRATILLALAAAVSAEPIYARTNETITTTVCTTTGYIPSGTGVIPTLSPNATTWTTGVPTPGPTTTDLPPPPPEGAAAGFSVPLYLGAAAAVAIGAFQL